MGLVAGNGFYGIFPLEVGAFYNVGVAWMSQDVPWFINDGSRKACRSCGFLARANLLGFLIRELDWVNLIN